VSAATIDGIGNAIAAHLADVSVGDPILTDWFVAYGSMKHDADADEGIVYDVHYATSQTSPQGSLGIAQIGLTRLNDDVMYPGEDDDDD
jgi:hypothetical protein